MLETEIGKEGKKLPDSFNWLINENLRQDSIKIHATAVQECSVWVENCPLSQVLVSGFWSSGTVRDSRVDAEDTESTLIPAKVMSQAQNWEHTMLLSEWQWNETTWQRLGLCGKPDKQEMPRGKLRSRKWVALFREDGRGSWKAEVLLLAQRVRRLTGLMKFWFDDNSTLLLFLLFMLPSTSVEQTCGYSFYQKVMKGLPMNPVLLRMKD